MAAAIQYYLVPNTATPDPNDQSARVATQKNHTEADLAQEMFERNMVAKPDLALGVINYYQTLIAEKIANGDAVNTVLCTIRPGIQGVFTNADDTFDPARHTIRANFYNGPLLDEKLATAAVEKIQQPAPAPVLVTYTDTTTGHQNSVVTPGEIALGKGENLKGGSDPTEGFFFINVATGVATRVTKVARLTNGEVTFLNPTLAAGDYWLEARRLYGANKDLLRVGRLGFKLTVA